MNSCGTGIPVFTPDSSRFLRTPDSCSRQMLSCSGQLTKSLPTSSPTSKLTAIQTPKHAPKHVVYSIQYHVLLQLNLNTKIVCCCRRRCCPSSCHLPFCRTSSSISLPKFFAWRWRDCPPPIHLQFALAGCCVLWLHLHLFLSSLQRASSFSCPPAANLCLLSYRGTPGFRDAIASCLLAPPPPFASCSLAGCCNASRRAAAIASCPFNKPASFCDAFISCLPLVCRLVVMLMPPPLLLLTRRLRLLTCNLCLLTPLCLLSTGASPPVCLLFADCMLCCLSPCLRCFTSPYVALLPHLSILYPLMSCRRLHLLCLSLVRTPTGCCDASCGTSTVFVAPSLNTAVIVGLE